jgi:redox-sensitive bicupin YhaK (pirin superfamily)
MIQIRSAASRGHTDLGWLQSAHSFSFGDYQDPRHMGLSNLRVINDDRVAPGRGFATHGHTDMEIVSYVLEGALEHRDSMGNGSVIRPGDVQRMSAGSGVRHSELNPSPDEPVHFLQIWLIPKRQGGDPEYSQRHFPESERRGRLRLLVSPDGRDGSVATYQDALVYGTLLQAGEAVTHAPAAGRRTYVHVARGRVELNGTELAAGDGAAASGEPEVRLTGVEAAEVLLFDVP